MMQLLALSGSLREASRNTTLLNAAADFAPENVEVIVYRGLGELPHFNPDLDKEPTPPAVADFRAQLQKSAGVIISSPEYAHGVPGMLKNALDWLVASGELYEKPVALFNASPRALYAQACLRETLSVMMAKLIPEAFFTVPLPKVHPSGSVSHPEISGELRSTLATFAQAIRSQYQAVPPTSALENCRK